MNRLAVQLVTRINRYIGTAAEIAALTLTDIPVGSTFFESDTGILKILNAAGALVEAPSESVSLSGSKVADTDSLPTHLTTLISGEDQTNDVMKVEQQFSYKNLAAVAETVVKSTPGLLHLVTINTYGNTDCTLILYDNTSAAGTKIATIDVVTANLPTRIYDVMFTTGLTVVIAGTGTICDITVSYR